MDTSLGQEDAMTFAFEAAEKLRRVETLVREVVACELLTAYQAWSLGTSSVAAGLSKHIELLKDAVQPVAEDRPLGGDIATLVGLLGRGAFDAAETEEESPPPRGEGKGRGYGIRNDRS
jgi:histidine ammonia-lyase